MNYLDIFLCIPLLWGFFRGLKRGFIIELSTLISFGLAIYGAVKFSNYISAFFKNKFNWTSDYLSIISFVLLFLLIILLIYLLARLIESLVKAVALGIVNKLLGAVFGTLKYALILSVFLFMLTAIETKVKTIPPASKEKSKLYKPLAWIAPRVIPGLERVIPKIYQEMKK